MGIPLPGMMRHLREQDFAAHGPSRRARAGLWAWTFVARRPALYRRMVRLGARMLKGRAGAAGRLARLPFAAGWTTGRDLPAPEGGTFMDLWNKGKRA